MTDSSDKGYIQIYTGNGKGKTTAALGLALRAAGHGIKTYIAQFMKGQHYGELDAIKKIDQIVIEQFGADTFVHVHSMTSKDRERALRGLAQAEKAMLSQEFGIIILDEVNVALHFKLLTSDEVLSFIRKKPEQVELILTGRKAPNRLVEIADLVTEMREIKHYFQQGIGARDGIEK